MLFFGKQVVDQEKAVVCIQAHVRGWQARHQTREDAAREAVFLGFAANVRAWSLLLRVQLEISE